jgi:hypothetical protein
MKSANVVKGMFGVAAAQGVDGVTSVSNKLSVRSPS